MNKKILIVIVVAVLALVGIWAVIRNNNSDENPSSTSTNTSQPQSASNQQASNQGKVSIENMMFTPSQITVQKGETVTWTNNDNTAHTVTDDLSNAGGPASGDIQPGSTYSFTFNKTGSFQYHCSIHPSMRGTIVVSP